MNKVKVVILGKDYTLQTEESPNYVYALARQLEAEIKGNMDKGASQYTAAVMAALSAMDDLNRQKRQLDATADMTKDYVDDASQARLAAEESNKENRILRAKVDELQSELKKRTTVIRYDNEKVENARDMLSREINAAINSPLSRPTVQQINADPDKK